MYRYDRPWPIGRARPAPGQIHAQTFRAEIAGVAVDIDKRRYRSGLPNRRRRRDKGHWARDHLVARPDPNRGQCKPQGVGAARHSNHVAGAQEIAKFLLEGLNLRTAHVRAVFLWISAISRWHAIGNLRILGRQIDKFNAHEYFLSIQRGVRQRGSGAVLARDFPPLPRPAVRRE